MSVRVALKVETEAVEMRKVFAETMIEMAREDPRVVYLECDLMNSIGMVPFSKEFPERTINCGIQEANMIGVASGPHLWRLCLPQGGRPGVPLCRLRQNECAYYRQRSGTHCGGERRHPSAL